MIDTTDRKATEKAEREAEAKAKRRAEQAAIVTSLQAVLESNEQLLAFARGKISGGWRGKLNIGPEAFFAPDINIALTERRVVLQHIHTESGKPSEILPHTFPISDIAMLTFSDVETFSADKAARLVLRLNNEQQFRIRVSGETNFEGAQTMAEVFQSLIIARRRSQRKPTETECPNCHHVLDQVTKFCPYCGAKLAETVPTVEDTATDAPAATDIFGAPPPVETPVMPEPPAPPEPSVPTEPAETFTPPSAVEPPSFIGGFGETPAPPAAPEAPTFSTQPPSNIGESTTFAPEFDNTFSRESEPLYSISETTLHEWIGTAPTLPEDNSSTASYEQPTSEMLSDAIDHENSSESEPEQKQSPAEGRHSEGDNR